LPLRNAFVIIKMSSFVLIEFITKELITKNTNIAS
jgi:hypothetical protein